MSSNPTLATAAFKLSSQQERAWLQHEAGIPQVAQAVIALDGELRIEKLKQAVEHTIQKYEILRTVFRKQSGIKLPFQVIPEQPGLRWEEVASENFDECLRRDRESVWDCERGPMVRTLLSATNTGFRLALTIPAFCADRSTLKNFFAELALLYPEGDQASAEAMQYLDLVEWQNEMLASEETKAGREFWRDALRAIDFAALSTLSLPQENAAGAFQAQSVTLLASDLVDSLDRRAARLNVSVEDILLSAWASLLSRLTGQAELTLGYELDGRRYEELTSAFGPLARSVPLKLEVQSALAFEDVARSINGATGDARNWQECFLWGQIQGAENQVLPFSFAYQECGKNHSQAGITFSLEQIYVISEGYKLQLVAMRSQGEHGPELRLHFHYDAARFERRWIERVASYYQNLLASALENPTTPVCRLSLLPPGERRQQVVEWNQTVAEYPVGRCLHQLFEQQAAKVGERAAVECRGEVLSYRELNQRANRLAHFLRKHGVGPDRPVGMFLDRSTGMMVALLAIMKAGGAYVALNPEHPAARLKQQLEGAVAVITEAKLVPQMPDFAGLVVVLDGNHELWANEPSTNPVSNTGPENFVYVIYTSGSTGVPKAVAVRHRNLVNYTDFITKRLELEKYPAGLDFATVTTLGADLGNTCIFPALVSGGCLHLVTYEAATDPRRMAEYLSENPVDVLKIVPSHLEAWLQAEEAAELLPRKYLILGGETLTPKLLAKIEARNPDCQILNHYGPTETTVGSLTLRLEEYPWRTAGLASIPIGRPIQNTQVYILDQNLEPLPVGVIGELYIAGAGVTAGYLGQPAKTEERFLANPFSEDREAKMYRTGDLARYLEDGNIEFLGRGDDQVKIRGFRIELGEIEAVLGRQPSVQQAVVVCRTADSGEKRLLGYVVLGPESSPTGEALRANLKKELPDYMVPQAVVVLDKLPLNANGKIDRRALPEPDEAIRAKTYVAPRTETEKKIAEIWAEVLPRHKSPISVEDNFFDLGGHSLLATQVVSRIRRILNLELPLRLLFEFPTVARLAEQAEKIAGQATERLPMIKVPRDKPLLLSFAQQRLWVLDQIDPQNSLYNVPRALRLKGQLNTKALLESLNEIVRRHESLRTVFAKTGDGTPVQVCQDSLTVAIPMTDLSERPAGEREPAARELAAQEARIPFDLARGPLLRAKLLRLDDHDHVLLLTMHHIVSDAWSAGVFFQELGTLYSAYLEGKSSPLSDLPIQYADYAMWQRNWLKGKLLEEQLSYWREHLRGAPPLLALPSDRPRPEVRRFAGAYERVPLPRHVFNHVEAFSQQQGVTPFMTMLAAFKALLARYSGQEHIVLGTDIANRTSAETERLIGFFINLLPLHTDLSGDPSFREVVLRVREVALGAYAHQDIPFDKLVEDLQPERKLSHNPIVQALFVMQNVPASRRELPGLELDAFAAPLAHSKFDLAVFIQDTGMETLGHWVYSTELFERKTILGIASHYQTLLAHAIQQPDTRLSALEIYSAAEKREREREKTERKQSQRQKLMAVQPKSMSLAEGDEEA